MQASARGAQLQRTQLIFVGEFLELKDQRQGQPRLQVRQLHRQLARRGGSREQQASTGIAQAVEQMEKSFFPLRTPGDRIQIIQTNQLIAFQIVENLWARSEERRVGKECSARGQPQAGKKNIAEERRTKELNRSSA